MRESMRQMQEQHLASQQQMHQQNLAIQQQLLLIQNAVLPPPIPVKLYDRGYVPGTAADSHTLHAFEKQVLADAGRYILNPNVRNDTVTDQYNHTWSGTKYIKEMAKRCITLQDRRAANLLASGVHSSIRTIIQGRFDEYKCTLPNG